MIFLFYSIGFHNSNNKCYNINNMGLNVFTVTILVLSGLANLFLAIYVYKNNPKERINKYFFYFGLFLSVWCLVSPLVPITKNLFWVRVTYSMGSVLPIAGIFFAYALADKKLDKQIKIFLSAVGVIIFIVVLSTPLLIKDAVYFTDFGYEEKLGPLFVLWGIYLVFSTLTALYIPFRVIDEVNDQRKKQILYYLIGATMFSIWAVSVSIIFPFLGTAKFSNVAPVATIFMISFTSYSIIRYNLMDISSLFFRAFIYSLVIVSIIAFLLLLVFVSSFFFGQSLVWPIYLIIVLISVALFFIGRLFFTERRELEKAKISLTESLKGSEESRMKAEVERDKTATIISSFSDGLIILDEKDKISSINPEAEKVLELETSKLLKKPFQLLEDFPKAKPVASILNTGFKNIFQREVELAKDFVIELSVIPLNLDENGIGHLIELHDVSREKIVEKMKTEFVSLAAHQLRTPLSVIKWSMSMLKRGDFGKLAKKQDEAVKNALQNNEKMIFLVNDLLKRVEEGKYLYKTAMADLKEIVDLAINSYKDEIKNKKIKIDFKKAGDLPQTIFDTEKIKIVVQNLIDNAIKYSPEGAKIVIVLKSDGKNIEFGVQNLGPSIPKDQQDKVFTKFFRGDNAIKINATGSGLGLFLVKNIIETHGGKIWFESEENMGTNFHFSLPIKKKSAEKYWDF